METKIIADLGKLNIETDKDFRIFKIDSTSGNFIILDDEKVYN